MDNNSLLMLVGAVVLVLVIVAALLVAKRRRSERLQSHFGPEYSRVIETEGDAKRAETQLHEREKRVHSYSIRPLSAVEQTRFVESWRKIQSLFVDNPKDAVARADALLTSVMSARGYPMTDFEQRSADLSVDYPVVIQNYRTAHDIALKHERGEAGTEELRQAMIHYRDLFEELLDERPQDHAKAS